MDSRLEFVRLAEQGGVSAAELCRRFGISRQTGFQYLRRYRASGIDRLKDRSRWPHSSPRRTPAAMETQIVELREAHPWGASQAGPPSARSWRRRPARPRHGQRGVTP